MLAPRTDPQKRVKARGCVFATGFSMWNSSCRCESDQCRRVGGFRVQRGVQRGNWDWCFLCSYVIVLQNYRCHRMTTERRAHCGELTSGFLSLFGCPKLTRRITSELASSSFV
ncbi:tRNA uridine(34) hydroxylase [Trichinella pseudospiralis]